MLTQSELKEKFIYIAETGLFYSIKDKDFKKPYGSLNKSGYVHIKVGKKMYRAHRLAWLYMTGEMPNLIIDHINQIKNDNRFSNLRQVNDFQNMLNRKVLSNNKVGIRGVSFHKASNKWRAQAKLNGHLKHLGSFDTPELASKAYNDFAKVNHGDFYHDSRL